MSETPTPIPFVDDPNAPEVFASRSSGFFKHENNIVITFESVRVEHSTAPGRRSRVVVGRIVMPISGAQEMVAGLNDFLERQGVGPSAAITGGATRQ